MHVDETVSLAGSPKDSAETAMAGHDHGPTAKDPRAVHQMRGLVVGLHVDPKPGYVAQRYDNARNMRLVIQKRPNRLIGNSTAYGFVLQNGDSVPQRDSVDLPGPVLELERGKPVRINVVNNLDEPTGVHWHGLEIESYPDGVPNFSGMKGGRIMPPIMPGDSLLVEYTPPRSGTFLYHSHLNELHQIESGMYGAIVVSDKPRDKSKDLVIITGGGGPVVFKKQESPFALVNGRRFPRPLRLTAGETYRIRLVSIHPEWRVSMSLRNDSSVARWRAVAKDGADLPPAQATERSANIIMGPGETADFEFTPKSAGEWTMEVKSAETGWYVPLPVIVSAPSLSKSGGR
jgi:FtsP/CotA-like multicopper oxidase with cupredoxin domain